MNDYEYRSRAGPLGRRQPRKRGRSLRSLDGVRPHATWTSISEMSRAHALEGTQR